MLHSCFLWDEAYPNLLFSRWKEVSPQGKDIHILLFIPQEVAVPLTVCQGRDFCPLLLSSAAFMSSSNLSQGQWTKPAVAGSAYPCFFDERSQSSDELWTLSGLNPSTTTIPLTQCSSSGAWGIAVVGLGASRRLFQ